MSGLENLIFLVIDDNRHMVSVVRTLLRAFGAGRIEDCTQPESAFERFQAARPDIIIANYNMAPLDGVDLIRLVRRDTASPNPFVPIILLTAHSERRRIWRARDAGVTEVLVKPIAAQDLFLAISAVIECPRPFINVPGYFGPCRRHGQDPRFRGLDRREAQRLRS